VLPRRSLAADFPGAVAASIAVGLAGQDCPPAHRDRAGADPGWPLEARGRLCTAGTLALGVNLRSPVLCRSPSWLKRLSNATHTYKSVSMVKLRAIGLVHAMLETRDTHGPIGATAATA